MTHRIASTTAPTRALPRALVALVLASGAFTAPLAAQSDRTPTPLPTRDSLDAISRRGRLLWEYDAASWIATDSIAAHRPAAGSITGYVARPHGDRWDVAFGRASADGDTFYVAYEARQRQAEPNVFDVVELKPPRADTGYYARSARAVAAARADFGAQSRPYNAAVIERPDGLLWVYLMPAQLRMDVYPLGGDVRYLFAADGRTVVTKRRLHNAIIEAGPPPAGANRLAARTHTAVLDDIVEDTDVFHVLGREPSVPEYVVTESFVYVIAPNGAIRVGRRSAVLGDSAGSLRRP